MVISIYSPLYLAGIEYTLKSPKVVKLLLSIYSIYTYSLSEKLDI